MTDTYKHGVYTSELPTALLGIRTCESAVPVFVGAAPFPNGGTVADLNSNSAVLGYNLSDYKAKHGYDSDFSKWGLCEAAHVQFDIYGIAPAVFVNVMDPATHKSEVEAEARTVEDDKVTVAQKWIFSVTVKDSTDTTTYVEGTDYTAAYDTGIITRLDTGSIGASETLHISYSYLDPSKITATDIIGQDLGDGARKGLWVIDEVFPKHGITPGFLVCPNWSQDASVAAAMGARVSSINGVFKAMALIDVPDTVTDFTAVNEAKTVTLSATNEHQIVFWPKVKYGDEEHWLSVHFAALAGSVDAEHDSIPYVSPSNKQLLITGTKGSIFLGRNQANDSLNKNGIVTVLNWGGSGWVLWGNRTAAYPVNTDPKDSFISIRRSFNWVGNTFVLTFQQKVDFPLNRRLVETVVNTGNIWLNGLVAKEIFLAGAFRFLSEENPSTDLMDGSIKIHIDLTPPSPARNIQGILEYDVSGLEILFGV